MKPVEPRRLLDATSGLPDGVRSTLEAGLSDLPTEDALARIAARLPLLPGPFPMGPQGGSSASGPAAPSAAPSAAPAAVVGAPAAPGALATLTSVLPFAGIGAVLATVVVVAVNRPAPATGPSAAPTVVASAVDPKPVAPARIAPAEVPMPEPSAPPPHAAPVPVQSAPSADAAESEDERELRLLKRAQDALSGSPSQALELAAQHGARFPRGRLAQEREVIAITALVSLGRMDEARARANAFASRFPSSAHLRRIQSMIERR